MQPNRWRSRELTFWGYISCGFPSPAEGFEDDELSFDELLVPNRPATHFFRVRGHHLEAEGIQDGSIVVIDRSITPVPGRLVLIVEDGQFRIIRLRREPAEVFGPITACVTCFRGPR